jgi:hypothetical protein
MRGCVRQLLAATAAAVAAVFCEGGRRPSTPFILDVDYILLREGLKAVWELLAGETRRLDADMHAAVRKVYMLVPKQRRR